MTKTPEDELRAGLRNAIAGALGRRGIDREPITPAEVAARFPRSRLRRVYNARESSITEIEVWLNRHGHSLRP